MKVKKGDTVKGKLQTKAIDESKQETPVARRLRGRPKKDINVEADESSVSAKDVKAVKKGRGVKTEENVKENVTRKTSKRTAEKRTASVAVKEEKEDEEVVPPKRVRGRPKRTKTRDNGDEEEKDVKDEVDVEMKTQQSDGVADVKKKKRSKQDGDGADVEKTKQNDVKVKEEEDEVDVKEEKEDEEVVPPKRVRGRPKRTKTRENDDAEEKDVKDEVDVEMKTQQSDGVADVKKKRSKQDGDGADVKKKTKQNDVKVEKEEDEVDVKKNKKKSKVVEPKKGVERSVLKKGLAAVDGVCPIAPLAHVYCEGDTVWDCMLNQTNIQFNNNKYYIIQLLKDDHKAGYYVWMRWGRVGATGQSCLKPCTTSLQMAKDVFQQKFSDKTRNSWENRESFVKVPGKYDLLRMDYSDGSDTVDSKAQAPEKEKTPPKKVECLLDAKVRALIELICDVEAMEDAVVEMKYDAEKAPLGRLTANQVKAGYAALKDIETIILAASGKPSNRDLVYACNKFYTRIPHNFGMRLPPLITTTLELQEKMTLLQSLSDIQAAMNIISQPLDENIHPVDQRYKGLECDIEPLDALGDEYKLIQKYLSTTHGKTHSLYKMSLQEVFKVTRSAEDAGFESFGHRMLLWHGSRLTNWAGILSQGLRIAPPESPSTGFMFGKGIYFADMSSKSANYCMPSYQTKTGLLVLCDVALGKAKELLNADYNAHENTLKEGFNSVKGLGRTAPDPKNYITTSDGVVVPMGPGVDTTGNKYTLQYNEYIVYNVAQVKIKYLVKVQFNFK